MPIPNPKTILKSFANIICEVSLVVLKDKTAWESVKNIFNRGS